MSLLCADIFSVTGEAALVDSLTRCQLQFILAFICLCCCTGNTPNKKIGYEVIFTDHLSSTKEGNVFSTVCDSVHRAWDPHPMMHWDRQEGCPPSGGKDQTGRSLPGRASNERLFRSQARLPPPPPPPTRDPTQE